MIFGRNYVNMIATDQSPLLNLTIKEFNAIHTITTIKFTKLKSVLVLKKFCETFPKMSVYLFQSEPIANIVLKNTAGTYSLEVT